MKNLLVELIAPVIFVILFIWVKKDLGENFDAYIGALIVGIIVNLRRKVDKLEK